MPFLAGNVKNVGLATNAHCRLIILVEMDQGMYDMGNAEGAPLITTNGL